MNLQIISTFFWQSLLLTSSLFRITAPVLGEEISNREIPLVNQIKRSSSSAQMPVQLPPTPQTEVTPVTGVKVNSTDKGLEVILETGVKSVDAQRLVDRHRLQVTSKTEGNSYIADILNAQLRLTSGNTFRQQKPVTT